MLSSTYCKAHDPKPNVQVNPARAPEVVGALLDAEAPDDFVNNLILSVRSLIPVERLCAEVEQRNRLKLLSPFLEHLVSEGSQVRMLPIVEDCCTICCPAGALAVRLCGGGKKRSVFGAKARGGCRAVQLSASPTCSAAEHLADGLLTPLCRRTRTCTTHWARSSSTRRTIRSTS